MQWVIVRCHSPDWAKEFSNYHICCTALDLGFYYITVKFISLQVFWAKAKQFTFPCNFCWLWTLFMEVYTIFSLFFCVLKIKRFCGKISCYNQNRFCTWSQLTLAVRADLREMPFISIRASCPNCWGWMWAIIITYGLLPLGLCQLPWTKSTRTVTLRKLNINFQQPNDTS